MKIIVVVSLRRKKYLIELDKLLFVLSKLSGKDVKYNSTEELLSLMDKYSLMHHSFLDGMAKAI